MASKREFTVALDENLFEWAALTAKLQGQTLSDYIARVLSEQWEKDTAERLTILNEFFEGPGWPGVAENWPKRDELYDRDRCCSGTIQGMTRRARRRHALRPITHLRAVQALLQFV